MEDIVVTVLDTNYIPEYETKEEERRNNEEARVISENERIQNESTRISNEEIRQTNETDRIAQYNLIQSKLDNNEFNGDDGYSPTVTTSKTDRTTTITITDKNGEHVATILDGEDGSASGDMLKSVYDTNNNGIVDNAEKVNNHTVQTDVPANAVFTDTVFSGDYNDLSNRPSIPTKTSDLTNDAGYLTSHQDISGKQDIIQYSTMPTASSGNLGKIAQYIGTTTSSYTNGYFYKCVSDGASTPTYSWEELEVQAGGGGASYTAGTNIEITSENVINNTIPYEQKIGNGVGVFLGYKNNANDKLPAGNNTIVGSVYYMNNIGTDNVLIGTYQAFNVPGVTKTVSIGSVAKAGYNNSIALGCYAETTKSNQCMIGSNNAPINEVDIYTSNGIKTLATTDYLTTITGYDATKTQVLKNVQGTLTWVDE